jgi:hypothetical protein
MKRVSLSLVFLLAGALGLGVDAAQKVAPPGSPTAVGSPAAVVRELYGVHRNGYGHIFEKKGKRLQEKFFDKRLAGLIWKDLTETPEGEMGHIDFDPLFSAQDMKITNLRVGTAVLEGNAAVVPVSFNNYQQKVSIKFRLVNTSAGWKIENIIYGDGSDLLKILSEPI